MEERRDEKNGEERIRGMSRSVLIHLEEGEEAVYKCRHHPCHPFLLGGRRLDNAGKKKTNYRDETLTSPKLVCPGRVDQ